MMGTVNDSCTDADKARFASLKRRCAFVGVDLREAIDCNGRPLYQATKWALPAKELQTLDALAAWVAMVDGKGET
jgi:hypothetical protein